MGFSNSTKKFAAAALGAILVLGCAAKRDAGKKAVAKAEVSGFESDTVNGSAHFIPAGPSDLRIKGEFKGLQPNRNYAIHIHELGNCDTPDASGSHFDPGRSGLHGAPGGALGANHAGDLPNLETDGNGVAKLDFTTTALSAGSAMNSVVGRSIVIHAGQDDFQSQPAGGAGEKIACGVIQPTGS